MGHHVERDVEGNKLSHRIRPGRFLAQIDTLIRWKRLVAVVEPHYPKELPGRGPPSLAYGVSAPSSPSCSS